MSTPNYESLPQAGRRLRDNLQDSQCYITLCTVDENNQHSVKPFLRNWSRQEVNTNLKGALVDILFSNNNNKGPRIGDISTVVRITNRLPPHMRDWHMRIKIKDTVNVVILILKDTRLDRLAKLIRRSPYWTVCFRPPNHAIPPIFHSLNSSLVKPQNQLGESLEYAPYDDYIRINMDAEYLRPEIPNYSPFPLEVLREPRCTNNLIPITDMQLEEQTPPPIAVKPELIVKGDLRSNRILKQSQISNLPISSECESASNLNIKVTLPSALEADNRCSKSSTKSNKSSSSISKSKLSIPKNKNLVPNKVLRILGSKKDVNTGAATSINESIRKLLAKTKNIMASKQHIHKSNMNLPIKEVSSQINEDAMLNSPKHQSPEKLHPEVQSIQDSVNDLVKLIEL